MEILGKIKLTLKKKFAENFVGKQVSVLAERKREGFFEGYSKEYLRVYFSGDVKINSIVDVKITEPYLDGAKGEIV